MPSDAAAARTRIFLVVVDDSPERDVALRYACLRVRKGGGKVALLRVVEPIELVEWAGVGVMMQEERRDAAEAMLSKLAENVTQLTGGLPILLIREGHPRDALLELLAEDERMSVLVLASAPGGGAPGPLIAALTGRYAGKLTIPLTIVPGEIGDRALDRVT